MSIRENLVCVARACLGTVEGSPEHKTIIDIYNHYNKKERKYNITLTDPWCAAFVSAVFIAAGYPDKIPIECSCFYMLNLAKLRGIARDPARYVPKPGDVVMYKWRNKKMVSHTGIVAGVNGSELEVIEGNYNNRVGIREIKLSYQYINSYIEVIE